MKKLVGRKKPKKTCSSCGRSFRTNYKPDNPTKPIYCSNCFKKHKPLLIFRKNTDEE